MESLSEAWQIKWYYLSFVLAAPLLDSLWLSPLLSNLHKWLARATKGAARAQDEKCQRMLSSKNSNNSSEMREKCEKAAA